jgi:hypothetical protein
MIFRRFLQRDSELPAHEWTIPGNQMLRQLRLGAQEWGFQGSIYTMGW